MIVELTHIFRYPVKGLSGESLPRARLRAGRGVPGDRRYALAHAAAWIDVAAPVWAPKKNFLTQMSLPRLAALKTRWIEDGDMLIVERNGRRVACADLGSCVGRTRIADFFSAYLKEELRGTPRVIDGGEVMFSDHERPWISMASLSSLRDLERVAARPLEIERFRPNLAIDGAGAWKEFSWIGKEASIGDARVKVMERIGRCRNISVDPNTGEVDDNLPRRLLKGFGHKDFGVFVEVISGGVIEPGAVVTVHD